MASVTTITNSHAPIVARVPLPAAFSLIVAEFVLPYFFIEDFNQSDTTEVEALSGKLSNWTLPETTKDRETLNGIKKHIFEVGIFGSNYRIATASNAMGLQGVIIYDKSPSQWNLYHMMTTSYCNGSSKAGTALMNHLIDGAIGEQTKEISLYSYLSAMPFYLKFGFVSEPVTVQFMSRAIVCK